MAAINAHSARDSFEEGKKTQCLKKTKLGSYISKHVVHGKSDRGLGAVGVFVLRNYGRRITCSLGLPLCFLFCVCSIVALLPPPSTALMPRGEIVVESASGRISQSIYELCFADIYIIISRASVCSSHAFCQFAIKWSGCEPTVKSANRDGVMVDGSSFFFLVCACVAFPDFCQIPKGIRHAVGLMRPGSSTLSGGRVHGTAR